MSALKIKLFASSNARNPRQAGTLVGLGLKKFGQERLVRDTPPIRGMLAKVQHMVSFQVVEGVAPIRKRTKRPVRAENK